MRCCSGGLAVQQTPQQLLQEWHLEEQLLSRKLPQLGLLTTVLLFLYIRKAGDGSVTHLTSMCLLKAMLVAHAL